MKKYIFSLAFLGLFVLIGAGCNYNAPKNTDEIKTNQVQVQTNVEEPNEEQEQTKQEPAKTEVTKNKAVTPQDIKNAFSKKYPKNNYSNWTVKIDKYDNTYARGSIGSTSGMGGAGWYAKKINGVWTIVADGQAIECSDLTPYNFPTSFKSVYCG